MKKKYLITLWCSLIVSISTYSQPNQSIRSIDEKAYELFDIQISDISYQDKEYRIYIAQAKNQSKDEKSAVLYMLDGNGMFPMLLNQIDSTTDNTPVIVGIGYPVDRAYPKERTRDYTVPSANNPEEGGGASQFYQFLTDSLKPFVEDKYNIDRNKQTLAGHSFGGHFTLYVLFNHTSEFQNFVAASPSLWWGNGAVIPMSRPFLSSHPKSIIITQGEYEEHPERETDVERRNRKPKKIQSESKPSMSTRQLAESLKKEVGDTEFILFSGKNHGTSVPDYLKEAYKVASESK